MMKRLLAIFPLVALLSVLVFPRTAAKATEATIYFNSVPDTIPYANLLAILQAGGSFDLEGYKSNGGTFESFIQDLTNYYGDVLQIPDNLYKKLKAEWQDTRIRQDQSQFLMPWAKENFARQIAYDSKFYQKILDNWNTDDSINNVPEGYVSYVDAINGSGFDSIRNIQNTTINYYGWSAPLITVPLSGLTFYSFYDNTTWNNPSGQYPIIASNHLDSINIIYENNTASVTISRPPYRAHGNNLSGSNVVNYNLPFLADIYSDFYNTSNVGGYQNKFDTYNIFGSYKDGGWTTKTFSGALSDVLTSISNVCRNVNIYINGEPWFVIDDNPNNSLDFNDVIGTNYDDLAYDVVVPTNNDLAFDLTAILQYLYGGFANTFSEAFDFSSLWDIGAIVDTTTGEAVDGADADTNTKSVPIAKAIEDEATDEAEVTPSITPTPDPDGFPIITITPIPIDNALVGSTILAEIVDATQNALPSQLIDAFWGIVFICFFIGIIWTFHK